jgi:Rrf2 family protein
VISQTTEYALRAAVRLATAGGVPMTVQALARDTRVPAGYLAKVLQHLGRAGVVTARRGVGGGFVLARPPRELPLLDVVNAVDPVHRIRRCPVDMAAHGTQLCPLHRHLDNAMAALEQAYATTTLAQILNDPVTCRAIPRGAPRDLPGGVRPASYD